MAKAELRQQMEAAMRRDDFEIHTMADVAWAVVSPALDRLCERYGIALQRSLDESRRAGNVEAERDALKAAIEALSARHQPTIAKNLIRCDRHVNMRRVSWEELRHCSDCRDEPITVCSNLTCCEYPCEDRRAIDAALAAREETGRG